MKQLFYILFYFNFFLPIGIAAQSIVHTVSITSPDKKLKFTIFDEADGSMYYRFSADNKLLIDKSRIGRDTALQTVWKGTSTRSVNTVWKPLWGKRSVVPDKFNEVIIDVGVYKIICRAYNEGIAFMYDGLIAEKEHTQFNFAENYTAWSYQIENMPIGPEKLMDVDSIRKPVMTIQAGPKSYMAVHEAALENGEPIILQKKKGSTAYKIVSKRAKAWRVVMYGLSPGNLVDAHLLELLNPPSEGDFSWVRPGVAVWDWRINGAVTDDGYKYTMALPSWQRMIDFAATNNMMALVLDANWYGPEFNQKSDPIKGGKVQQVQEIIKYGKQKNIGVWLYLNDVGGRNFPIDQILKQYGEWGAAGVKYGFMSGSMEEKNMRTRLITKLCAENRLMVDFHDNPVHPYGQMRTWPNALTREYCHAQSDGRRIFVPSTFVSSVFVHMLAGPLDMNNGTMDMEQKGRVDNNQPVPATVTAEAARTLITFSGATIIPDIPENYAKYPELLQFIKAQQMPWKESITLAGEIGEYIVMARQNAEGNWLIGAATNEQGRELDIPLHFLGKGKFEASISQDGEAADYRTNKTAYKNEIKVVSKKDVIRVKLAPGGGACIEIRTQK